MKNRYLVPVLLAFSTLGLVGEAHAQAAPAVQQLSLAEAAAVSSIEAIVANTTLGPEAQIAQIQAILGPLTPAQRLAVAAQAFRNTNSAGVIATAAANVGVNTEQMANLAGSLPSTAGITPGAPPAVR